MVLALSFSNMNSLRAPCQWWHREERKPFMTFTDSCQICEATELKKKKTRSRSESRTRPCCRRSGAGGPPRPPRRRRQECNIKKQNLRLRSATFSSLQSLSESRLTAACSLVGCRGSRSSPNAGRGLEGKALWVNTTSQRPSLAKG